MNNPSFFNVYKKCHGVNENLENKELVKVLRDYINKHDKIPKTTQKHYTIIKLLGEGSFGKVYLGLQKLTNRLVAIKCLSKSVFKEEKKKKINSEIKILKKFLGHPNIIKLLEVFENSKRVFFVMEYASSGDLLKLLAEKKILNESDAKYMFVQICTGLRYIHNQGIIHRDIKLDNILLDNKLRCKICDFGVSRLVEKD